jgi:transcriptional regulator of acetoin/glycerol metabolism
MDTILHEVMADYFQGLLKRAAQSGASNSGSLPTLEDLVEEYIHYLLRITSDNVALTARILKVSRSTLYKRLRRGGQGSARPAESFLPGSSVSC